MATRPRLNTEASMYNDSYDAETKLLQEKTKFFSDLIMLQRDHEQTKKSSEMARADRARLEQVLLKLQALGTSLDRLARDAQEYNAKKSELEVLSEDFVHLDRHMKEKGNSLTAKVVNLENRTARLEKYVFDQEKPIL